MLLVDLLQPGKELVPLTKERTGHEAKKEVKAKTIPPNKPEHSKVVE